MAPAPHLTARRSAPRRASVLVVGVITIVALASSCVGSGKTAQTESLEPLPPGLQIVSDLTTGCREGESGFDYRWVVIGKTNDLSYNSPFLTAMRDHGFYHSKSLADDLPWMTVGYQNEQYPYRAEIGLLSAYLSRPIPYQGPPVDALPIDVRAQADQYLLVAMRPTDFACATPL
jgi:hypothetical protein